MVIHDKKEAPNQNQEKSEVLSRDGVKSSSGRDKAKNGGEFKPWLHRKDDNLKGDYR